MDYGIRPLWEGAALSGPAFTVRLPRGQHLALHAAIYTAAAGSVLVVQAGDTEYAVAGGNVCAVAQQNGIAGMVIDGVIRDLAEIRAMGFPVFARGVRPIPGSKKERGEWQTVIECGGVSVAPGDIIVANEEGVVCVPAGQAVELAQTARAKQDQEIAEGLARWKEKHRTVVEKALAEWNETL